MTKHRHLAACLFALAIALGNAPAEDVLPAYPQGDVPDGITIPEIIDTDGHAVGTWFNTHPGCPDSTLTVEFTVSKDGKVSGEVALLSSSGIPTLDKAFLNDLQEITFKPATKDGIIVASRFRYGLGVHRLSVCSGPRRGRAITMP